MESLNKLAVSAGIACIALSAGNMAQAASITFEGLPATELPAVTPAPESVLTNDLISEGVLFGKPGTSAGVAVVQAGFGLGSSGNAIVGLDAFGNIPDVATGDIFFSFALPGTETKAVTDFLSFSIGDGGGDTDIFQVRLYDLSNTLISALNFAETSRFTYSQSLPGINRVEVDFSGEFGYSLDDLVFNTPTQPEPIPTPALLPGLIGMGITAYRKRKQESIAQPETAKV